MSPATMDCRRAQELLSDHLEATLAEPLLTELDRHLARCGDCRALRAALAEVVLALRQTTAPEPSAGRAARWAEAALRAAPPRQAARRIAGVGVPAPVQLAAAVAALAASALVYVVLNGPGGALRQAARMRDRGVNAGVYLAERTDRFVEDLRVLRLVVGAAFGSRVEGLGERVEDYRRLVEKRRASPASAAPSTPREPQPPRSQTRAAPQRRAPASGSGFSEPAAAPGRNV